MAPKKINCPLCKKTLEYERPDDISTFPFCSERCRLADLDMWLEGDYRISSQITEDYFVQEADFNSSWE